MTAEQILEKHLLSMLNRTDESYESIDEMKQQPEWQAVINAMLEYSEMKAIPYMRTFILTKAYQLQIGSSKADDEKANYLLSLVREFDKQQKTNGNGKF